MNIFKNGKLVTVNVNGKKQVIASGKPTTPTIIPVTNVSITNKITSLMQGDMHQLQVNILPSNATDMTLRYTSSNISVATVDDSTGLINALAEGYCDITVTSNNNITDTVNFYVMTQDATKYIYPNDLGLYATTDGILVSEDSLFDKDSKFYSSTLQDTISYNETEQRYYINKKVWKGTIRDFNSAIRSSIYVAGEHYSIGDTLIGNKRCRSSSSVPSNPTTLSINIAGTVPIGHNSSTDYTNTSEQFPLGISTYSSFNGLITTYANPYSMTSTDIVNFMNGREIRWVLENAIDIPLLKEGENVSVDSLTLNKSVLGLQQSTSKQIIPSIYPPLATNKTVIYETSDSSVATVDNAGVVTSVSEGNCIITAKTQDGNYAQKVNVYVDNGDTEEQMHRGAYLQIYYFEPKVNVGNDLVVQYYISDSELKDYYEDDKSESFSLIVCVDGVETKYTGIKAGDGEVNLGNLSEGKHWFYLQGIDETTGAKGFRVYREVWIINPDTYNITEDQTYHMTEGDLVDFNIVLNLDDTATLEQMQNNRAGLNTMMNFYKNKGYRKLVLLNGIYRIDCASVEECVTLPSDFTLDGNGATFKRMPMYVKLDRRTIKMYNLHDSHVTNLIIEDDQVERAAAGLVGESGGGEPYNTIVMNGCRYSTVHDITIKHAVGHSVGHGGSAYIHVDMKQDYIFDDKKPTLMTDTIYEKATIINGVKIEGERYWMTPAKDLKTISSKYITFRQTYGYTYFKSLSQVVYFHFYDEDADFVISIPSMEMKPIRIPYGCRYVRASIELYTSLDAAAERPQIIEYEFGTHNEFKNIDFIDCQTCCFAPSQCRCLLIDSNTYTRCGNKITASPVDFEDGWHSNHDALYRNNNILENGTSSASMIAVSCVNGVFEGNLNHTFMDFKECVTGCAIRNTENSTLNMRVYWNNWSRYNRVYNNNNCSAIFGVDARLKLPSDKGVGSAKLHVNGGNYSRVQGSSSKYVANGATSMIFRNSDIIDVGSYVDVRDSNVSPADYMNGTQYFTNCTFFNSSDINTTLALRFNAYDTMRKFDMCTFKSPINMYGNNKFNTGWFKDCSFENTVAVTPNGTNNLGDIQFDNCTFEKLVTIKTIATTFVQFNNCTFKAGYSLTGSSSTNVQFNSTIPSTSVTGLKIPTTAYSVALSSTTPTKDTVVLYWITPANASNKNLICTSSDTNVATVDNLGIVTCIGAGTAVITFKTEDGGYEATATFTVTMS